MSKQGLCYAYCFTVFHWQNWSLSLFCKISGSSLFYKTSARHEQHECDTNDTSATRVRRERHECDTSATRVLHEWEILILITTIVKTYFHTTILAIWQMKDYKERKNFIIRITFWKCFVPMPKYIWKVHHKNWTF